MRELTLQELEEVAGGWDISFSGAFTTVVAGLAGGAAMALGAGVVVSAVIAGSVVFVLDNMGAFMAAQNDLWSLELEYARMTIS